MILADEINRASPRTQSALLEAMSERQVTIEGRRHPLGEVFLVIATQNPIEYHGTYPLPEAQLDRFAMQLEVGYPSEDDEIRLIVDQRQSHPLGDLSPVASTRHVVAVQERVRGIDVEESVTQYLTAVVRATRGEPKLRLGASPRAALILYRCCQALAFVRGRDYVVPDDVKELAGPVLAHRVVLDAKSRYAGVGMKGLIRDLVETVRVPA